MTVSFFLLIAALVCFLLATFGGCAGNEAGWHRIGFGWLGAALITITLLLGAH